MDSVIAVLQRIWTAATTPVAAPSREVVLATAAVALVFVLLRPLWSLGRHAITIAHEGAHGLVATLARRRLDAIKLHSDTSGLTVSAGRPDGPGMVATAFAGYIGPMAVGVGAAALLHHGYALGLLWLLVALLAVLLIKIRNLFGLWSVLVAAGALVAVSWLLAPPAQTAVAYAVTWFLLLGAVRPVLEVQRLRARGRTRDSDPDQLARLTRLPGLFWVVVYLVLALGGLALAVRWLVPSLW